MMSPGFGCKGHQQVEQRSDMARSFIIVLFKRGVMDIEGSN